MINSINSVNQNMYINSVRANKTKSMNKNYETSQISNFSTPTKYVSFAGTLDVPRTILSSQEQKLYAAVATNVPQANRSQLELLLRSGILLNSKSNDNSTVLDSMYKIATETRAQGLDKKVILAELINTLSNPFVITQKFGDIPNKELNDIINNPNSYKSQENSKPEVYTNEIKNVHSSACVAASIEFDLASKQPAEFARIANGLTSDKISADKKIKLDTISKSHVEAYNFLNEFNAQYQKDSWDDIIIKMQPDRNAIVRARIQMTHKDPNERSLIDVLMQSTFMNIGSQKTYNSLTDKRTGKYNPDDTGLTDIEKSFAETVATGKNKYSITYQKIDDDGMITGYEYDLSKMRQQIVDALKTGENVIVGYTQQDETGKVINGHEITIVRLEKDKNGKEVFVCNDTDDESDLPVKYYVDDLLPAIHHAGLPASIAGEDNNEKPVWYETMAYYKDVVNKKSA